VGAEPRGIETRVLTHTGSTYEVVRAGGRWYFRAVDNRPNPNSRRLDPEEWWWVVPHPVPGPPVVRGPTEGSRAE
jgi:hypothetical protein